MASQVLGELCEFTGLPPEETARRMAKGIRGTAESYREGARDPDRWYRETDAYLFELANWEEGPVGIELARVMYELASVTAANLKGVAPSVLEYGCGIGSLVLQLASHGLHVVGCDINGPNRRFLEYRIKQRGLGDQVVITTPDRALEQRDSYVTVSCQHVLEHVVDPSGLLSRIFECLIPGGSFLGVAPFGLIGPEFPEHKVENAHLQLEDLCEQAGFGQITSMPFGEIADFQLILVFAVKVPEAVTP
jgi:SAM-dependent methyltransferase